MYQILLVDDEPIFLEYMQNILDWEKYHCQICACACDGKSALAYIEKYQPDLAFLDISMPLMNGIEVSKAVKEKGLHTHLIFMTGHDEFSFAYQAIKMGIDDYMLKPFSKEELITALQKVLQTLQKEQDGLAGQEHSSTLENMGEGSTKYEIMTYMIDDYLNQNYAQKSLSLTRIAGELGFESSYLRRVYKITTGITIMQKLEDIRIAKAKKYLNSGKYQSQEISEMVGFSDPYYFSKRFKKVCGVSPSEWKMEK